MSKKKKSFNFDFNDVLRFLNKWKFHLLILAVIAIILSSIFSGPSFITPKYKASVIFYPTTINSVSMTLLADNSQKQKDPLEFGEEAEAEQALQILKSSTMTDRLVRNFDLMKHYGIDPNGPFPYTQLGRQISGNFSFKRTQYLSIDVSVMDKDPVMAAKMANGVVELLDTVKTEIQRQVAVQALQIIQDQYQAKEREVNGIKRDMEALGAKGVTNYDEQMRVISEEIGKAKSSGKSALVKELEAQQTNLSRFGGDYISLKETLILELEKLSNLKSKLDKAKVDVETTMTHKFIVSSAGVPEKKAYPIRWLIVFFTTSATLFFGIVILGITEKMMSLRSLKNHNNF